MKIVVLLIRDSGQKSCNSDSDQTLRSSYWFLGAKPWSSFLMGKIA